MGLIEIKNTDFEFEDERGLICQICHGNIAQVNYVFSKKGAVRGRFHYHKQANEHFYVIRGKLILEVYEGDIKEEYEFGTGDYFLIPSNVHHNFIYVEDTQLISMYDCCIEKANGNKDIYQR